MITRILFLIVFAIATLPFFAQARNTEKKSPYQRIIYGENRDVVLRIGPPASYGLKSAKTEATSIHVTYKGFDSAPEAKAAVEYAIGIWESLIYTTHPIEVQFTWGKLEAGVLGSAGPENFYANKDGFAQKDIYYPTVLAEKMSLTEMNKAGNPDILASFNSSANWYYGTDGKTPLGKYDLASVVMHELCHGLGFTGSFYTNKPASSTLTNGYWGYNDNLPMSFDQFITNTQGKKLIDTTVYANGSYALYKALTNNSLFFKGPVTKTDIAESIKLYAPSSYDDGSSTYHLDNNYSGTANQMMTYSIGTATSIHDPGPIVMAIMGDIGWKHIEMIHTPMPNSEEIAKKTIELKLDADFEEDALHPKIYYVLDRGDFIEKEMTSLGNNLFSVDLNIDKAQQITYYFKVTDHYNRDFILPYNAPDKTYQFKVGPDNTAPTITHTPTNFILPEDTILTIIADIADEYGLDSTYVEYRVNGGNIKKLELKQLKNNTFNLLIDLSPFEIKDGDKIEYRVIATDQSVAKNRTTNPAEGFHEIQIKNLPEYVDEFQDNFEKISNDFQMDDFAISTPTNFSNGQLGSLHPYNSAGEGNHLNYTAQLRYPIKIKEKYHNMQFDEIILVEPGETGASYLSEDFYDYVIVEGSKNDGKTWLPVDAGYDSRLKSTWLTAYNSKITGQNSVSEGTSEMFSQRLIDLTQSGNFKAGDLVTFRFRLYSDPYAYGWGWAIDNLKIQTEGLKATSNTLSALNVYPNPVKNGIVNISSINDETIRSIKLYSLSGQMISSITEPQSNTIQLQNTEKGLHIIQIETNKQIVRKKIIIE